jgi:ElaB/YqjD/DUF883 family membrane-anchored ribosome-binding protein
MTTLEQSVTAQNSALNSLKSGIERTAVGTHGAIRDAVDAAHPAVDQLGTSSHGAVDKASGIATSAVDAIGVKTTEIRNAQARLTEGAKKYVHENPLLVLGLAALVGYTASRYLNSRVTGV